MTGSHDDQSLIERCRAGETEAFGPSVTPGEIWNASVLGSIGDRVIFYEDLIEPLRARGYHELCSAVEGKMRLMGTRPSAAR